MTGREKIKFLHAYLDCEPEIIQLQEEIERWVSRAEKVTGGLNPAGRGGGADGDRLQTAVEKIGALREELAGKLDEAVEARRAVEAAIRSVGDRRLESLLRFRYVEGWTWERIAVALNLQYRWTLKLHGQALNKITLQ